MSLNESPCEILLLLGEEECVGRQVSFISKEKNQYVLELTKKWKMLLQKILHSFFERAFEMEVGKEGTSHFDYNNAQVYAFTLMWQPAK